MAQCVIDYEHPRFGGETFDEKTDGPRLRRQLDGVRRLMRDGGWRSLRAIASALSFPEASVSARLRQLRHEGFDVQRRRVHVGSGTWEYRVVES